MSTRKYVYLSDRIKKLMYRGKEFMIIDHSDSREKEMINNLSLLSDLIKAEKKPVFVIAIFNARSFVTPPFMRHTELITAELGPLIENKALVGLNAPKKMILQGQNAKAKTDVKSFDSVEEAIEGLLTQPALVHSPNAKRLGKQIL